MIKDRNFYNTESTQYSSKRYPERALTYVQHFFKKRLQVLLAQLQKATEGKNEASLLEVGCADGIVIRKISENIPGKFTEIVGVDTAEGMISVAKDLNQDSKTSFFVRGEESLGKAFDIVIEVGVANYTDFDAELAYARDHLNENGVYMLSIAGKSSTNALFGRGTGYQNFLSYEEYEEKIKNYFAIKKITPVGIYMPALWRVPFFGRFLQPIIESLFRFFPNLYHEKLYTLFVR